MTDDRFDRELAARLRAYESRLPDAAAPVPGSRRPRRRGLPVLLVGAGAAVAAVVLALVVMQGWGRQQVGEPSPSPSVVPTIEPVPTDEPSVTPAAEPSADPSTPATPSPAGSPTPPSATTDLDWNATGSFRSSGDGPSMVQHLVSAAGGYVAIGVEYAQALPNVGPTPPHALLTWWSADGRAWEVVDQGAAFDNVEFISVVERADGQILAIGRRSSVGEFGYVEGSVPAAWVSADGRTWSEVEIGLPAGAIEIVRGGQGYLALVHPDPALESYGLWHSSDAITWTLAHTQSASRIDIGAGDEGFVAVGRTAAASDEPFAVASGDGLEWFAAGSPPPTLEPLVAALGGDWIATSAFHGDATMRSGETWRSANGLDWAPHGESPLAVVDADGAECQEYPRDLHSAGPWLVASTDLSYPCSEGGFAVHGSQFISLDGSGWGILPFEAGTPGEPRSGSLINAAIEADGSLLVGGEMDGVATLWFGEQP